MRFTCFMASLLVAALCGCARPAHVVVRNDSDTELRDLVVTGHGFTHRCPNMPPRATCEFTAKPRGEGGVAVAFEAGTRHVTLPEQGYFEAGYRVTVVIAPDLGASVTSTVSWAHDGQRPPRSTIAAAADRLAPWGAVVPTPDR